MTIGLGLSQRETGILDSIPEPVVIVDNQRAVVAVNRAAGREIGVGYAGRALALSLRHPVALAAVDEVLSRGVSRSVEVTFRTPTQRTYAMLAAPLQSATGTASEGAVLVFHDVTSERRAQQMRADFVANASHELRSPLSAIVGSSGAAVDRRALVTDSGRKREFLICGMAPGSELKYIEICPPSTSVSA